MLTDKLLLSATKNPAIVYFDYNVLFCFPLLKLHLRKAYKLLTKEIPFLNRKVT